MTTDRRQITEATAGKLADQRLWKWLATDPAYLHAADADAQAQREEEISERVWGDIEVSTRWWTHEAVF